MRTRLRSKVTLLFIVCAALFAVGGTAMALVTDTSGNTAPAPTIQSDKDDYRPGETVTLTGSNWQAGESVHINVNDDEGQTWSRDVDVTADANGAIQDQFQLPTSFVAVYKVTATGAQSGVATTSFTDGNVGIRNASTSPSDLVASYKLEAFGTNQAANTNCSGTAQLTRTFSITGGANQTVSATGTNPSTNTAVATGNNNSVRVTLTGVTPTTQAFKEWNFVDQNASGDGAFFDTDGNTGTNDRQTSFCLATQNSTVRDFIGVFQAANQAPVANNQSVTTNEDTAKLITLSATDADSNPLTYKITSLPTNGKLYKGDATAVANQTSANEITSASLPFTLPSGGNQVTYVPNANYNTAATADTFKFKANDGTVDSSNEATVSVTVNAVNDAPVNSVPGAQQSTNEDTALTFNSANNNLISISDVDAGTTNSVKVTLSVPNGTLTLSGTSGLTFLSGNGTNDSNMAFTGTISNINSALNGMSFTPNANVNGPSPLIVNTDDQGNTGSGGAQIDSDAVSILVNPVNDAPSFTKGADQAKDEDAGAQTVTGWATNISAGPADENGQTVSFQVTNNSNPSLFSAGPAVSSNGTLTYTPAANANGTATVTLRAQDNGGTANGGVDTSATQTFTITINAVNDKPSFTSKGNDQVDEDFGPRTVPGWVTTFNPGPVNESTQNVDDYIVTDAAGNAVNSNLFTSGGQPDVSNDGTLSYTPAPDANGSITLKVKVRDNGGTANNGQDTSDAQDLTITVNPVNDAPVVTFTDPTGDTQTLDEDKTTTRLYKYTVTDVDNANPTVTESCGSGGSLKPDESGDPTQNSFRCLFADDATTTVSATADDGQSTNNTGSDSIAVTVKNVPPKVNLTGLTQVNEGATETYSFTITDPGADTFSFVSGTTNYPTCGQNGQLVGTPNIGDGSFQCHFPDGATNVTTDVSVKVQDDDNGVSVADTEHVEVLNVQIDNVAPTVTAPADQTANEGASVSFNLGSFTDPGLLDSPWAVDVDWGDSSTHGTDSKTATGSLGSMSHTYANNGTYTVTVSVTDKNNGTNSATFKVNVSNVNPNVTAPADDTGVEGSSKSFALGSFTDPGPDGPWQVAVNWGDSSAPTTFNAASTGSLGSQSHTYADNGTYTVTVSVTDKDNGTSSATFKVVVTNVAPDITSFTSTPYFSGPLSFLGNTPTASKFSGAWTDPGADTWKAELSYQDGSPLTQQLLGLTTRSFSDVGHTFASAGCKSTSLKVTDDDLESDTATTTTEVGTAAFMAPMTNQPVTDKLKNGQVLPVKVKFTDCNGAPITNLTPAIRLVQGDQTPSADDTTATITPNAVGATADTMGIMRSNGDGSYIYNMSVNITLNKDYTVVVYPYGTNDPRRLGHVIMATK
jgi:PKD domain/Bacterial cadherin-like domain/Bacterial Ig domain